MPNYCDYTAIVGGYHSNVDHFIEIMNNDYDKTHMYRIFEAVNTDNYTHGLYKKAIISGCCAWSVFTCMFPGPYSYYDQDLKSHKENEEITDYITGKKRINTMENFTGTNLLILAKQLKLDIYVYSTEPGMCFCEEYRIMSNGMELVNREGNFNSYYIDEYDTFKEFCEEYQYDPNELPFDEADYKEMKQNDEFEYNLADFECDYDSVPDKPNYLTLNYLYRLRKDK